MEQDQISGVGVRPLCCTCVPVRLGVFLIALLSVVTSVLMVFAKGLGVDTSVAFGGYVLESKVCIAILEVSGAIWGVMGLTGSWNCHSNSVSVFFYFQVARLVAWCGVFFFDLPALYVCETWITDMASQPEWNPRMYQVAMEGQCFQKRMLFYSVNIPLFLLFAYFTYVTYLFIEMLNGGLPYIMNEKKCHRAYVSQSLAERMPLNLRKEWDPFPLPAGVGAPLPAGVGAPVAVPTLEAPAESPYDARAGPGPSAGPAPFALPAQDARASGPAPYSPLAAPGGVNPFATAPIR